MSEDNPEQVPDRSMFDFSQVAEAEREKSAQAQAFTPSPVIAAEDELELSRVKVVKAEKRPRARIGCMGILLKFALVSAILVGLVFWLAPTESERIVEEIKRAPWVMKIQRKAADWVLSLAPKEQPLEISESSAVKELGATKRGDDCNTTGNKMIYTYVTADGSTAIVDSITSVPKNKRPTMTCRSLE